MIGPAPPQSVRFRHDPVRWTLVDAVSAFGRYDRRHAASECGAKGNPA
jgi:hypothetical protein